MLLLSVTGLLCSRWQYWFHWWWSLTKQTARLSHPCIIMELKHWKQWVAATSVVMVPTFSPVKSHPLIKPYIKCEDCLLKPYLEHAWHFPDPADEWSIGFWIGPLFFKTRSFRSLHLWICWIWISICSSGWYFTSRQPDSLLMYVYAAVYDFVLTLFRI